MHLISLSVSETGILVTITVFNTYLYFSFHDKFYGEMT